MGPETDFTDGGGDVFRYLYSMRNVEQYEDVGGGEGIAGDSRWRLNIVSKYYFE